VTNANVFQLCQPVLLASHADKLTDDGRQRLVRHGHLPEREIMTGIGPVAVRCPRVSVLPADCRGQLICAIVVLARWPKMDAQSRTDFCHSDNSTSESRRARQMASAPSLAGLH